jgi:hypothetical protein
VVTAFAAGGYESFSESYPTDHRTDFFNLGTTVLFGLARQSLVSTLIMLHVNNVEHVTACIREKYERLRQNNTYAREDKLCNVESTHHFAERIDSNFVAACFPGEVNIQILPPCMVIRAIVCTGKDRSVKELFVFALKPYRNR